MAFHEKRAWISVVVSIVAYSAYLSIILARSGEVPLAEVPYVATMLWTIGIAIVATVLLQIGVAISDPKNSSKTDERDREIGRFGELVGMSFVVIGGVAALGMSMAAWNHFWIANVIYLCFALSSLLGSLAKIAAYRHGVPRG